MVPGEKEAWEKEGGRGREGKRGEVKEWGRGRAALPGLFALVQADIADLERAEARQRFASWIEQLRDSGRLKNDDVHVVGDFLGGELSEERRVESGQNYRRDAETRKKINISASLR